MRADLARPIDPTSEPLFGFALFKVSADRFFWYARYHHIVMDGLSMALVARRLADVYTKLKVGPAGLGGVFGKLTDLLDEDAAYRTSEQFAEDRQYLARPPERPAGPRSASAIRALASPARSSAAPPTCSVPKQIGSKPSRAVAEPACRSSWQPRPRSSCIA